MKRNLFIAIAFLSIMADMVYAVSVYSGTDPNGTTYVGVRYRYFHADSADKEIYIGIEDMSTIDLRSQVDVAWKSINNLTITYDGNVITASIFNGSNTFTGSYIFDWDENTSNPLNYFEIDQVSRDAGTTASLLGLTLNGESLGDFAGDGWNDSYFYTQNLQNGFTMTGQIVLSGVFSTSREDSMIQISMGYAPIPAVPEPLTCIAVLASIAGIGRYVVKYRLKTEA